MEWILEYIQGKPSLVLIGGAAAIFFMYRKEIMALIKKWTPKPAPPVTNVAVSQDPDILDMLALKRLQARGKKLGCEEFIEGVDACFKCFFHTGEEEPVRKGAR